MQGTERKDRANLNEPIASSQLRETPEYLDAVQAERFAAILASVDGMGIASKDDVSALAVLAVVECEIEQDTVLLAEIGAYYIPNKESGIIRAYPAVARMTANRQRAQALWNEFGRTPAARSKVSAGSKKMDNPYAALNGKTRHGDSRDEYARHLDAKHAEYLKGR